MKRPRRDPTDRISKDDIIQVIMSNDTTIAFPAVRGGNLGLAIGTISKTKKAAREKFDKWKEEFEKSLQNELERKIEETSRYLMRENTTLWQSFAMKIGLIVGNSMLELLPIDSGANDFHERLVNGLKILMHYTRSHSSNTRRNIRERAKAALLNNYNIPSLDCVFQFVKKLSESLDSMANNLDSLIPDLARLDLDNLDQDSENTESKGNSDDIKDLVNISIFRLKSTIHVIRRRVMEDIRAQLNSAKARQADPSKGYWTLKDLHYLSVKLKNDYNIDLIEFSTQVQEACVVFKEIFR